MHTAPLSIYLLLRLNVFHSTDVLEVFALQMWGSARLWSCAILLNSLNNLTHEAIPWYTHTPAQIAFSKLKNIREWHLMRHAMEVAFKFCGRPWHATRLFSTAETHLNCLLENTPKVYPTSSCILSDMTEAHGTITVSVIILLDSTPQSDSLQSEILEKAMHRKTNNG